MTTPKRGGHRAGSGRKSLYRPEIAPALLAFFQERLELIRSEPGRTARAPSFEDFSRAHGVGLETMRKWGATHPDFMNAYGSARYLRGVALELLRHR